MCYAPSKHTMWLQRRYNVAATSWRCSDVVTMLMRRCALVGLCFFIMLRSSLMFYVLIQWWVREPLRGPNNYMWLELIKIKGKGYALKTGFKSTVRGSWLLCFSLVCGWTVCSWFVLPLCVIGGLCYMTASLLWDHLCYKDLSFVWKVDRKIRPEDHSLASRGLPGDARLWSRGTDFSVYPSHPR